MDPTMTPPLLTSRQAHQVKATLTAHCLCMYLMAITDTDCLFIYRFWDPLFPAMLLSPGGCLATHTALPFSTFQGSTGCATVSMKVYRHAQHMFLQFCHWYGLLPILADQETLLYFATFLANAKGLQHGTIIGYLYEVHALHFNMGLLDPLKGALGLQKCLRTIHIQSNPESCKLAFTYGLLVLAWPLPQFPTQQVLWAALTIAHFGLLHTGEFTMDQ